MRLASSSRPVSAVRADGNGLDMTCTVVSAVDVVVLAREISRAASHEQKRTGRHCRLQDPTAVLAFLTALYDGSTFYAASRAAGFSEAVVRHWMKRGCAENSGVYLVLLEAVSAIQAARLPDDPVPLDAKQAARVAAAAEAQATTDAEARARAAVLERKERIRDAACRLSALHAQLTGMPLSALEGNRIAREADSVRAQLDAALREDAPATETFQERSARYRRWRRLTYRDGLTDAAWDLARARNFHEAGFE